ncbi:unnamed protein product [Orchesella dallaii]|uniref:P-type domain-containing protein n=1 Tax=Orchesella dallaii TaxID=48710 RepID=A0ABP1R1A2_9HEXA
MEKFSFFNGLVGFLLVGSLISIECFELTEDLQTGILILNNTNGSSGIRSKRSASCNNGFNPSQRIDCGWPGITRHRCIQLGCCFDSTNRNAPNCFIGMGGIYTRSGVCKFGKPRERRDCGYPGITKSTCESRSCCYDNRVNEVNHCFHSTRESSAVAVSSNRLRQTEQISNGIHRSDIQRLITAESRAISSLRSLKERVLKAHKDYSIAKTVGSSVSTAGAVATIAGVALAPFTAGWSLGLTVGGLTTTVLGAGTTLTTEIIETGKTKEWADELVTSLGPREQELKRIGDKIVGYPGWQDYVKQAAKGSVYVAFKGPTAIHLGKIIKYLAITAPEYGLQKWPAYYFAVSNLPGTFLLKTNTLLTRNLAKMGIHTVKLGVSGLQILSVGIGVVGIGMDIYTIVDTWTTHPELATQIDQIINHLVDTRSKLNNLVREF